MSRIVLPRLAGGAVVLRRWLVAAGDRVAAGDVVAEVASGPVVTEIESEAAGVVEALLVPAGTAGLMPGAVLARLGGDVPEAAAEMTAPRAEPERGLTVREALRAALAAEMERDRSVFVMGENVGVTDGPHRVTHGLIDRFGPQRVVDTPILERGLAGLCVGAAMAGLRPVIEVADFAVAWGALEQIVATAARVGTMSGGRLVCPIVLRGPSGFAPRAGAQLGQSIGAALAHFPGLTILQPWSAQDAGALLSAAIRDPGPVLFLESEALLARVFPETETEPARIGQACIRRHGRDITLVAIGPSVDIALEAADRLGEEGISAGVIDLRSLRPLDEATVVASVRRTGRCLTVEEGWPAGGLFDRIAGLLMREAFGCLHAPAAGCSVVDAPLPYAEPLDRAARPDAMTVVRTARRMFDPAGGRILL